MEEGFWLITARVHEANQIRKAGENAPGTRGYNCVTQRTHATSHVCGQL